MRHSWKDLRSQIPHRVKVDSKTYYEIVWIDQFSNPSVVGEMRPDLRQIVIKRGMSDKETVITYIHEICHLYSDHYGASLTENQILALEKGLHFVLKNGNIFLPRRTHAKNRRNSRAKTSRKRHSSKFSKRKRVLKTKSSG